MPMDFVEERIGREAGSTDNSLKFSCKWDQRNGIGYEIKGDFQIGDIRASLHADGSRPLETEKLVMQDREVIFTEGKTLGRKGRRKWSFILLRDLSSHFIYLGLLMAICSMCS